MIPTLLPHGELTSLIIKCFYATHHELGSGFSERIYQRALRIVLIEHGLRVGYNVEMNVDFHGKRIGHFFADLVVNDVVLLEIKALDEIRGCDVGQVLNYLKVAGGGVALLLNFSKNGATFKRLVVGDPMNSLPLLAKEQN